MVNNDIFNVQINELKKLSYDFYAQLSGGKEPLTYTFVVDNVETQVEVVARVSEGGIEVVVGFDTNWQLQFAPDTTKDARRFIVDEHNNWHE